jgi:hypothetical protein
MIAKSSIRKREAHPFDCLLLRCCEAIVSNWGAKNLVLVHASLSDPGVLVRPR